MHCTLVGMEFVVLNSLEVIQEAMGEKQDDFANRPHTWSGKFFPFSVIEICIISF